jgi:hypothetical protein
MMRAGDAGAIAHETAGRRVLAHRVDRGQCMYRSQHSQLFRSRSANLDVIGTKIDAQLTLVGRQYSTPVGPIDILARDSTRTYVVIELKKGRSADRVYGQCSRYMGWVRKNLAEGADVHGVIVARQIDDKLMAARDAHDTKVHLIEFEMKIGATAV